MDELIGQLFVVFAPIVADIIRQHHAETGELPTDDQIKERFYGRGDKALAEIAAWRAARAARHG